MIVRLTAQIEIPRFKIQLPAVVRFIWNTDTQNSDKLKDGPFPCRQKFCSGRKVATVRCRGFKHNMEPPQCCYMSRRSFRWKQSHSNPSKNIWIEQHWKCAFNRICLRVTYHLFLVGHGLLITGLECWTHVQRAIGSNPRLVLSFHCLQL